MGENLEQTLRRLSRTGGELVRAESGGRLRCLACGHRCILKDGMNGVCKVRFMENGELRYPWGYAAGIQNDPIEKKPYFHAFPGAKALSFGMLGCDLKCGYCQNWVTSQALRDPVAGVPPEELTPELIAEAAVRAGSKIVVSTYNEPLITAEWAVDVFRAARKRGLATGFVSNGNATPEVLDFLKPYCDIYKVDLKAFSQKNYRELGAKLDHILETIQNLVDRGFWVEIVTLLVPGWNDSDEELKGLTNFIASVSPLIPWHVTAYHPDYKMQDHSYTGPTHLIRAAEIAVQAGLKYIYPGNLPGKVGSWEDTRCHRCGETAIRRTGFRVLENRLSPDGHCPSCKGQVPGFWSNGLVPVKAPLYGAKLAG